MRRVRRLPIAALDRLGEIVGRALDSSRRRRARRTRGRRGPRFVAPRRRATLASRSRITRGGVTKKSPVIKHFAEAVERGAFEAHIGA